MNKSCFDSFYRNFDILILIGAPYFINKKLFFYIRRTHKIICIAWHIEYYTRKTNYNNL